MKINPSITDLLSFDNPIFKAYLFYSSVLVFKLLSMALLTAKQRHSKKVFANEEDVGFRKEKIKFHDEDVERVRRAHRNDLENILMFFTAAFGYILTNPSAWLAINLIRAFTITRIVHTIVYAVVVIPQPARAASFTVGYLITGYMAYKTLMAFW